MTDTEKQEIIDAVISQLLSDGLDITGLSSVQSLEGISTFPAVLTTTTGGVTTKAIVSVPVSLLTQAVQDAVTNANSATSAARSAASGWAAAAVKMGSDIVVIEGDISNLQDADKSLSSLTAYAECSTAANVSAKAVTVPFFSLPTNGGCLHVKMDYANTAVSGVTLNINATGAKDLLYNGSAVSATNTWEDNEVLEIYYDGTNYQATNAQGGGGVNVHYEENPEYVEVRTDANGKILWGIKADGSVFFGAGVPPQVVDYVNRKIAEVNPEGYEDVLTFLDELENGNKNLSELLGEKVDKEEGKSLIDSNLAESFSSVENSEYLQITTDANDKILQGIKADGTSVVNGNQEIAGNLTVSGKITNSSLQQQEQKVKQVEDSIANIDKIVNNPTNENPHGYLDEADNAEWMAVTLDSEGKIIEGVKRNGEKVFGKIPAQIDEYINETIDKRKGEIKEEIEEELVVNIDAAASKSVSFKNYGFSPLIRGLEPHPLVYSVNKFINRPLILPDGRIIYVNRGSSESTIKIINLDETESTLLTLTGASGCRLLWMDSKMNIYIAPTLPSETYGSIGGIWRLAYDNTNKVYANQFVHVLELYDENVMPAVPQDKEVVGQEHIFSIWTMTEDRNGRMYAGVYGQPYCPYLFVSTDDGETWSLLKNMETYAPGGKHIHFIEYNKYDNALYCTVGEINKLLKSTDGGNNWVDMGVTLEGMKSTSILCVEDGIVLGSDYTYYGMMYKVYPDGSYRTTAKTMANQFFSIRESDVTGWLYAFGRKPGLESNSYPPAEAVSDASVLQAWIDSNPRNLASWQQYHDDMETLFPDDCIIPQHAIVLISKDRGETWQILFMTEGNLSGMGGYFHNGEIGVSLVSERPTFIISEGKHKYTTNGIDVEGEVFAKVINGSSKIVTPII